MVMTVEDWDRQWSTKWKSYIANHKNIYPILRSLCTGKILDIGIGVTNAYSQDQDVTGVDISPQCIAVMKRQHPWGTWLIGDIRNVPLPDETFDTVVASHILEHFYDQKPIIEEMKRLAKPDGRIVIILPRLSRDPDHVHVKWNGAKIDKLITPLLKDAHYELRARNHYVVQGHKTATASVVMIAWSPTAHRQAVMKQSVQTLIASTNYQHKLIIVDNGPAEQTQFIRSVEPDIHIVNLVNAGPPASRNAGAGATESDFIAFVDNDMRFYDHWLTDAIGQLQRYPDRKLIAAPSNNQTMRKEPHQIETLDQTYNLSRRSGSGCWVMRRRTFNEIGLWNTRSTTEDHDYCIRAGYLGYSFIYRLAGPHVVHMALHRPTFSYKKKLVNGLWI